MLVEFAQMSNGALFSSPRYDNVGILKQYLGE